MSVLDLLAFVPRWQTVTLTESSASQSHLNDLCRVLDQDTPTEANPAG